MLSYKVIKRILDIIFATFGLLIIFPVFFIVFIYLLISNKGQPFFLQERPGKDEKIFKIIKFKTMNDKKDSNGELLASGDRITKTGVFFRKYSLDEIPQLLNVIKGNMSLIGPRPLLIKYLPRYNNFQKQRHNVKPGITGWAQVNGRNAIDWETKFELDIWYVNNLSLKLDILILFKTFQKIFNNDGIYTIQNKIPDDFMGIEEEGKFLN